MNYEQQIEAETIERIEEACSIEREVTARRCVEICHGSGGSAVGAAMVIRREFGLEAKVLYGGKQRKTDTEYVNVSLAMKIKRLKAERFDPDEEVKRRGVTPRKRKGAKRKRG